VRDVSFAMDTMVKIIRQGVPISLYVLIGTLLISLPLGFLVGLIRFKRIRVVSPILSVLISFFRGTPLIILIFLAYSALPDIVNRIVVDLGWKIDVYGLLVGNVKLCAIGVCSTFTTSTMSEIFRSALCAVSANQLEAAHSVGLSSFQAYIHIIIPQALISAIPNLQNDVVGLVKGTSLIFYMGVQDIMGTAKACAGPAYMYVEAYVDVLIVYVILCYVIQKLFVLLETRMSVYCVH
jgi:L-cystine transport system permease protein